MIDKCGQCSLASNPFDSAPSRCQNSTNENYTRPLFSIKACDHPVEIKQTEAAP